MSERMRHIEAAMVGLVAAPFAAMVWAGATVTDSISVRDDEWECTRVDW